MLSGKDSPRPRGWREFTPLIAIAAISVGLALISFGQVFLPTTPEAEIPRLTVQLTTERPVASALEITQDVIAYADGSVTESFKAHIVEADGWATVSKIVLGWSGEPEEWSCYVFNTPNPNFPNGADSDFGMSHDWAIVDGPPEQELAEVSEDRLPGVEAPVLPTVRQSQFRTDGRERVSGIECNRTTGLELRANARVAVKPTLVLIDVPELDRSPVEVRYERTAVRTPREWRLVTGSIDHSEMPDERDAFVRYLGSGTTAQGPLDAELVFTVPDREQWLNVSFASFAVVFSAFIGMALQAWADQRRAGKGSASPTHDPPVDGPIVTAAHRRRFSFGLGWAGLATLLVSGIVVRRMRRGR